MLSAEEVADLSSIFQRFAHDFNIDPSTEVAQDQPFRLEFFSAFNQITRDVDAVLPSLLRDGVSTGVQASIPPSQVWIQHVPSVDLASQLVSHFDNWGSATDHPDIVAQLIQQELDDQFVECLGFTTDLDPEMRQKLVFGKLGVAFSDNRKPRLVLDTTISGVNPRTSIQEKVFYPTVADVRETFSAQPERQQYLGFLVDIRAAHKCIKVKPSERGLAAFTWQGKAYRYKTCHFGATYSAYWWSRASAMIQRHIHILLFGYHRSFIYVDDFFFLFKQEWACIQAYLVTVYLQVCKVPISWHKTKLSLHPTWLGWDWDLVSMTLSLPPAKFAKLQTLLVECRRPQLLRRTVERLVGLLQWICQCYIYFRPFLSVLYQDLSHGGLTPRWMTRAQVESFLAKVTSDDSLTLGVNMPPFSAGCRILKLGQFAVTTKTQVLHALRTFTAGWILMFDVRSKRVKLSDRSHQLVVFLQQAISHSPLRVNLRLPSTATFPMAADAMATERAVGIGAWFQHPVSSQIFWTALHFDISDFPIQDWVAGRTAQSLIASWEMLAQIVLVHLIASILGHLRLPLKLAPLSDNNASLAAGNKLFTTSFPLSEFTKLLTWHLHRHHLHVSLDRVSSEDNVIADSLSRNQFDILQNLRNARMVVTLADICWPMLSTQGAEGFRGWTRATRWEI